MYSHPDIQYENARQRIDEFKADAEMQRLIDEAQKAGPRLLPTSKWRDAAFWASLVGPLVGLGFLAYFAEELSRAVAQ